MLLPDVDYQSFWHLHQARDQRPWLAAVAHIAERHDLDLADPGRCEAGRNVVLLAGAWVVKLVPPFWEGMWERECAALDHVHGRLSIVTPALRAAGRIDAWGYVVMERLPGDSVGRRGQIGTLADRCRVAAVQGRLVREIGSLEGLPALRWNWPGVLGEDRAALASRLTDLPRSLAKAAAGYVDAAGDLSGGDTLLHGDVSSVNLVQALDGALQLVDWSDAAVGPADHELISPLMHQFRGDPNELEHFWSGYGVVADPDTVCHRVMARSLLKYAALLPRYLADLPGPMPVTWSEAAERFTRIR